MSEACCHNKSEEVKELAQKHRKVLWIVLLINAVMFFVEFYFGLVSKSLSLIGDSLDMLGDALAYGSSLYVVGKSVRSKARSAQFKAAIMLVFGAVVFVEAIYRSIDPKVPDFQVMSGIGALALTANLVCLGLLMKHRNDDINFKSVWVCSRNDIIANTSVLVAAGLVYGTKSVWPDLLVGLVITLLFVRSAISILRESNELLRHE